MARRMNWRSARLRSLPKQSVGDEYEFSERDSAARWLERCEKQFPAQSERRQKGKNKTSGRIRHAKRKNHAPPTAR
jgi:hypothetical protein